MERVAGIDVGKARLDVSLAGGPVQQFANTVAGRRPLLQWLGEAAVTRVVCEPTGGYERALVTDLQAAGLPVVLAHPPRMRALARAVGTEAKTDLLDAQVLAHYGVAVPTVAAAAPDPARTALRDLMSRRRHLVDTRVQEKNRGDKGLLPAAAQSIRRHLVWAGPGDRAGGGADPAGGRRQPRVGPPDAAVSQRAGGGRSDGDQVAPPLPELGQVSGSALTALVGLAPWARDSGRQRAIAPFAAVAGRCGARCTWRPWSPSATRGAAAVLSAPAAARQAGQRGPGRRDAQAPVAPQRSGPPGHPWVEELAPYNP